MKFVLEGVKNGCRLGHLIQMGGQPEATLETPMCMLYTKTGSAPHLSRDVLDRIQEIPGLAHMPLPLLADHQEALAEYKKGIGAFTALHDFLVYTSVQDPSVAVSSGYNDKIGTAVWGRGGKIKLDVELFMKIQDSLCPDMYQALCDSDTDQHSSHKRCKKSVDRTLDFLDRCIEFHQKSQKLQHSGIIGCVEGGYDMDQRQRSAQETAKRPVAGFCIEGFHNYGPSAEAFHPYSEDVKNILSQTLAQLPSDKPRFMHGVWTPESALEAIELGIDVLDSSYPFLVTERGGALVFNHTVPNPVQVAETPVANGEENQDAELVTTPHRPFEIDLNDKRYFEDFRPVLPGCTCHTCEKHTRAYVHHLLNTSELLAGVLLMIHNCHHYFGFFKSVRGSIATGQFHELKELVLNQKR